MNAQVQRKENDDEAEQKPESSGSHIIEGEAACVVQAKLGKGESEHRLQEEEENNQLCCRMNKWQQKHFPEKQGQ